MWIVGGAGTRGLKGGLLCWRRASFPGKALAGAAGGHLDKYLAKGAHLTLLRSCASGLGITLVVWCFGFSLASLLCPLKCGSGTWL